MKTYHSLAATAIIASAFLAGCATPPYQSPAQTSPTTAQTYGTSYGVVDSIQVVNTNTGAGRIGAGAVVGGIVGGLLGNQVGGGTGNTIATAAGVVGGAVVGNQIEQRNKAQAGQAYQVGVRIDSGGYLNVTQDSVADLSIGSRVRVENGRVYRY
ncbi:MAG: glycine zipper 2TM domain-containing protein [Pseudomonadota bacterium]